MLKIAMLRFGTVYFFFDNHQPQAAIIASSSLSENGTVSACNSMFLVAFKVNG